MKSTFLSLVSVLLASGMCYAQFLPARTQQTGKSGHAEVAGWLADYKDHVGKVKPNPGYTRSNSGDLKWSEAVDMTAKLKHTGVISDKKTEANFKGGHGASIAFAPIVAKAKAAPQKSAADVPALMGCVSYADSWNETGVGKVGIYYIGAEALEEVSLHENMLTSYGQVYAGNQYFATEATLWGTWVYDMKYNIFDTRDWSDHQVSGDYNFNARAMTFDPVSRRAYAITRDDDWNYWLSVMDMSTYDYKNIGKLGIDDWAALMCNGKGQIYGIKKDGLLVGIDKVTGNCTEIGQTGLESMKMTSGTIDAATGRCFYVYYTEGTSELYEIDLQTAQATFLYAIPESAQILSLFVPESVADAGAPAAATQLAANFEGVAMSGEFTFVLPNTTIGGDELSGALSYTVLIDGVQETTGEGQPGENVSCPVVFTASGEYTFGVKVAAGDNEGELAALTAWVGYELPEAPTLVMLGTDNGKLKLTWTPVSVPSQSPITYTVIAYPAGEVVAENLTETEYTCEIPVTEELAFWSFGVKAVNGDSTSPEAKSSNYLSGYLPLPFADDLELASSFDFFTIIDANNDGRTWQYEFFGEGRLWINYSYDVPHDDWAVLHPVKFEKGKIYTIGCEVKNSSYYTEKLEIVVAKGNDVESLSSGTVILPPTDVRFEDYMPLTAKFLPEEDGVYYVAYHAVSAKYQNKLYLNNVSISKGISTLAPGAVGGLAISADATGALSAKLSFTAPVNAMNGEPISELDYVVVERDGVELGRVATQDPGEPLTFTDNSPVNGMNTYTVVAYNSYGRGVESEASAYIGLTEPVAPENIMVQYGSNTGEAVVTWTAPSVDVSGHLLGDTKLTYNVKRVLNTNNIKVVATGLTAPEFTEQVVETDADQVFVNYIIEAECIGGVSLANISNIYPLGRPETTPAKESFGGRTTDYEWGAEASPETFAYWDVFPNGELPFGSYDGGAMVAAYNPYLAEDNKTTLVSSLFDLSSLEKPVLTFYLFDFASTSNTLAISVNNGKTWTELGNVTLEEKDEAWKRKTVDLSAFKGQTICIAFTADLVDYNLMAIDNMRIAEDIDNNLSAIDIVAPDTAEPNEEFEVTVSYENSGKNKAENYAIELYRDDELIATLAGEPVEPEAFVTVSFTTSLAVTSSENPVFKAVINYAADEATYDNATKEVAVKYLAPILPVPANLSAVQSNSEVVLAWEAPDLNTIIATPSVDDLESYVPFSTGLPTSPIADDYIGDWTMYDVDGLSTYFSTLTYDGVGEPIAFVVYNSYLQEDNVFACHSGHQMFLSLASRPQGDQGNDDWLVSPELAGCEQTISFYAKSIDTYGADTFQVLYSSTGKEIADFQLISEQTATGEWKQYSFTLPEGATYFAVRCISYDMYAFLLDDFRMITAKDAVNDLEIVGYNVYCNGKRVNDQIVAEPTYVHQPDASEGKHFTYSVSCVFNHGESAPSAPADIDLVQTGIEDLTAAGIKIVADKGAIIVKGLSGEEVMVVDAAGRTLYTAAASGDLRIPVAPGIYIVKAGASTAKAIVK